MSLDQIVGLTMMGVGLLDVFIAVGVLLPKMADNDQRKMTVYGLVFGGIVIGVMGAAYYSGALTLG